MSHREVGQVSLADGLDRPIHAFNLVICPGVLWLCQVMFEYCSRDTALGGGRPTLVTTRSAGRAPMSVFSIWRQSFD